MDPFLGSIAVAVLGAVAMGSLYVHGRIAAPGQVVRARISNRSGLAFDSGSVLKSRVSGFPLVDRLPISAVARERMRKDLERAGLPWRVEEYLAIRVALAIAGAIAGVIVARAVGGIPTALKIVIPVVPVFAGWSLPHMYLRRRRQKRILQVERQLPDALTAISKSLRAGTGLLQALSFAAAETPAPLGQELQSALRELQLGAEPVEVFGALSARMGSPDLDIAVTAIVIQRTVGGNLSEILTNVTNTIRERATIQREIQVLTARQRLTSNLVAGLPIVVGVAFVALNPKLGDVLITTTAGHIALAGSGVLELAGLLLIRRLAVIEV